MLMFILQALCCISVVFSVLHAISLCKHMVSSGKVNIYQMLSTSSQNMERSKCCTKTVWSWRDMKLLCESFCWDFRLWKSYKQRSDLSANEMLCSIGHNVATMIYRERWWAAEENVWQLTSVGKLHLNITNVALWVTTGRGHIVLDLCCMLLVYFMVLYRMITICISPKQTAWIAFTFIFLSY